MRLLSLLFVFCFFSVRTGFSQSPQVATEYGPILGTQTDEVFEFLGIPFAAPPVGELRWRNTEPPESWATPLLTQAYSPKCPQKSFSQGDTTAVIEGNEDCLYLNVWTPDTTGNDLPVMVFIHGGGNQQGSASQSSLGMEIYNGKNMSQRGNVVVVTIQYRLGPLGYLVHPGLAAENPEGSSGNYAVRDQIMALQWVQNNIAQFGGDATRVMIFGESAGAVNVSNLLLTPMAAGLFSRAVIQSGGPNLQAYEAANDNGIAFAESLNATGSDEEKIAFLRSLSPETLVASLESPINGGFVQSNWKPVLDNHIFNDTPINIFQSGNFNKVPVIIGSNADEMSLSAPAVVLPATVDWLIDLYVPSMLEPLAHELYPSGSNNEEARDTYIQLLTDAQFTNPARRNARCISQNQEAPVFRYFFTHKHAGFLANYGSYHGMELGYIFNNWENSSLAIGPLFSEADENVQNDMLQYWVNFASSGDPNGQDLEEWPIYDSATDCYLEIKDTADGSQCGLRTEKSDLWDAVTGFTGCTTSVSVENIEIKDNNWRVFPNPSDGYVQIEPDRKVATLEVLIFDATGRCIEKFADQSQLDLSNLPPGVYLIQINTPEGTQIEKLIIH